MAGDVFGIVGTTQAGNFHVEQVVAEGGFGVVYRALHGGFRAPVALKCLKVSEARTPKERSLFFEKFREEAELLFRLSASIPEVVRPLHVDMLLLKDGQFVPFLALEWLEGESLENIINRRRAQGEPPMGLKKLLKLFRPIAHAIARAHRFPSPNGIVSIIHRDLKPENIFITMQDGVERPRILDFGIARARSLAEQAVGQVTGGDQLNAFSPAYAAPEQWVPKRFGQAGPWTDVWGLALTMAEVVVGRHVIDGEPQAMMGTALDTARRPTPRTEGANIPPEVDAVFERALAVNPRDRTKDIETFWTELEAAMGFAPSFNSRAALDEMYGPPSPPPASVRSRSIKQHRDLWLETPEAAPLEVELDLEGAPASLRDAVLSRRDGSLSAQASNETSDVGVEVDLPSTDTPPPSTRLAARMAAAGPLSTRSRELSTPPPMEAELAVEERLAPALPPVDRPSPPPPSRPTLPSISSRTVGSMGGVAPAAAPAPAPPPARPEPRPPARPEPRPPARPEPRIVSPGEAVALIPRPPARPEPRPLAPRPALASGLFQRAGVALLLVLFAAVILAVDLLMRISGDGLSFGPVRSFWLAAVSFISGAGLFFWRLLGEHGDG